MSNNNEQNDNFQPMRERYKEEKKRRDGELAKDKERFRIGLTPEEMNAKKEERKRDLERERKEFRVGLTPGERDMEKRKRLEELEREREKFGKRPKEYENFLEEEDKRKENSRGESHNLEKRPAKSGMFNDLGGNRLPADFNLRNKGEAGRNEEEPPEQKEGGEREDKESQDGSEYKRGNELTKAQDEDREKRAEEKKKEEEANEILKEKNPFKKIQKILNFLGLFSGAGSMCGDIFISVPTFFLLHLEFLVPLFWPGYKIPRWKKIFMIALDVYIFVMISMLIIMISIILGGGDTTGLVQDLANPAIQIGGLKWTRIPLWGLMKYFNF